MITRYLLIGALLLVVALGGFSFFQYTRITASKAQIVELSNKLTTANAALEQRGRADAIYRARLETLEKQNTEKDAELSALKQMDGRDAPLSDLLRATGAAADRLR